MNKLCIICHERPAVVPDRELGGRPIKKICAVCHGKRLHSDMKRILGCHKKNLKMLKDLDG